MLERRVLTQGYTHLCLAFVGINCVRVEMGLVSCILHAKDPQAAAAAAATATTATTATAQYATPQ